VLSEAEFQERLHFEQKRTERSRRSLVLMLVNSTKLMDSASPEVLDKIVATVLETSRETDIKGWYRNGLVFGAIFTEIDPGSERLVVNLLGARTAEVLVKSLGADQASSIEISLFAYPDTAGQADEGPMRHPDTTAEDERKQWSLRIKRAIDVTGSLALLGLLSPLMTLIAVLVKLTSRGPVFFRQQRVGLHGKTFTFLKFRSMRCASDPAIHERFVRRFITDPAVSEQADGAGRPVYKIKDDPRVTGIGRLLRRTSLDELPQLFNVLQGHMSLVGPRPPIPYEVECYDIWHRRRFLAVKPGITGLWQVTGRSRMKFDEMVRLDIRYAKTWSLGLDLWILLQTPRAVIQGDGAY
jgi:lipopolysaccharide/colanic/teichoic acid biosynthesis glycosyltransferase